MLRKCSCLVLCMLVVFSSNAYCSSTVHYLRGLTLLIISYSVSTEKNNFDSNVKTYNASSNANIALSQSEAISGQDSLDKANKELAFLLDAAASGHNTSVAEVQVHYKWYSGYISDMNTHNAQSANYSYLAGIDKSNASQYASSSQSYGQIATWALVLGVLDIGVGIYKDHYENPKKKIANNKIKIDYLASRNSLNIILSKAF